AVTAFAGKEYDGPLPSLEHPRFERVLYVHAAALATAQERPVNVDALMEDTLDHEEHFWREQFADRVVIREMREVVAALTLTGGVASAAAAQALVHLLRGAPDKKMAMLLRDLYPGRAGQRHIGGL